MGRRLREFTRIGRWTKTGHDYLPFAAHTSGEWWVLRLNSFPEHPLWTVFAGTQGTFELNDLPATWALPWDDEPLDNPEIAEAIAPLLKYAAYDSEIGDPCGCPYCSQRSLSQS